MNDEQESKLLLDDEEVETLEQSGLDIELGTPILLRKDDQEQQVIWPAHSNELPDEMFEHEFLDIEPIPTSGWVVSATYDWDSVHKKFVRAPKDDDGEG